MYVFPAILTLAIRWLILICSVGTVTRLFALDQSYVDPPSNATDAAWAALIPRGRGFVDIPEDTSHKSPTLDDQITMYSVSVFHQLHCLVSMFSSPSSSDASK